MITLGKITQVCFYALVPGRGYFAILLLSEFRLVLDELHPKKIGFFPQVFDVLELFHQEIGLVFSYGQFILLFFDEIGWNICSRLNG